MKRSVQQLQKIDSLHRTMSNIQRRCDEILHPACKIGFSQWRLLREVAAHPDVTQQSLALYLGQTEAAVSRQAHLLHKQRLVSITKDTHDGRKRHVRLTANGEAKLRKANDVLATDIQLKTALD